MLPSTNMNTAHDIGQLINLAQKVCGTFCTCRCQLYSHTHTRTQLFHNAASVLFTTACQLLPIRKGTMWWMMLFQKWSLERTCLWSEFKHSSSQVSACQKKPTIEMVLSFTGETENQACGGQDGGNDCLWWCFKVCVFLCLLVLFSFCLWVPLRCFDFAKYCFTLSSLNIIYQTLSKLPFAKLGVFYYASRPYRGWK